MSDLQLKRALRLKGMASLDVLRGAVRMSEADVRAGLQALVSGGLARETPRGCMLLPPGREQLAAELAAERAAIDGARAEAAYARFVELNAGFKALMRDWQIRSVGGTDQPNDHADAAYDAAVVARLVEIDAKLAPLLAEIAAIAPRLAVYAPRFADALAALRGGDRSMMAAPIRDSYHTVWFELHEELIDLCGRTRAQEAAEGRGD
ncbi:MAG: hypothetical protein AB7Q97_09750 [Gammaproteobacteria bacterium]